MKVEDCDLIIFLNEREREREREREIERVSVCVPHPVPSKLPSFPVFRAESRAGKDEPKTPLKSRRDITNLDQRSWVISRDMGLGQSHVPALV